MSTISEVFYVLNKRVIPTTKEISEKYNQSNKTFLNLNNELNKNINNNQENKPKKNKEKEIENSSIININLNNINNNNEFSKNSNKHIKTKIMTTNIYNKTNLNTSMYMPQRTGTNVLVGNGNSPKYRSQIIKLSAEVDNFREKTSQYISKLALLEENYFPFEKDPPNDINSLIKNYVVTFYFKLVNIVYLFIKRIDKNMNIFYFWCREEDALKYGVDYNYLNTPGIYFDTIENFELFNEMKKHIAKLQNISNEKDIKISDMKNYINNFQKEKKNFEKQKIENEKKINDVLNDLNNKNNLIITYENKIKEMNEKIQNLEKINSDYDILKEENEKFKEKFENYKNNFNYYNNNNNYNNNYYVEENENDENIFDDEENSSSIIYEKSNNLNNNIKENNNIKNSNNNNNNEIIKEKSFNNLKIYNFEIDYKHTIGNSTNEIINSNNSNESNNNNNKELIEKYEKKLKKITFKLKDEVEKLKNQYELKIKEINKDKEDIIINYNKDIQTLKIENENSKKINENLKYLIEIKESENKKLLEEENEISSLKKQIYDLQNNNEYYKNILSEKDKIFEENENKLKENNIKLKEKENQIENYSNIINYLQNLLDKNNIQYTLNDEEEQSNDFIDSKEIFSQNSYKSH